MGATASKSTERGGVEGLPPPVVVAASEAIGVVEDPEPSVVKNGTLNEPEPLTLLKSVKKKTMKILYFFSCV